ncbi:MAG: hypothetical protein AB1482_11680 [Pseudomonadota bacterium]
MMTMRVVPGLHHGEHRHGDYRPPAPDLTPTKVRVLRGLLLRGEHQSAGSILTVPRSTAVELVASGRAEIVKK